MKKEIEGLMCGADWAVGVMASIEKRSKTIVGATLTPPGVLGPVGIFGRGEVTVVAGGAGEGKTGFMAAALQNILRHKLSAIAFTPCASPERFVERLLAAQSGLSCAELRTGSLAREGWPPLTQAAGSLAQSNLWLRGGAGITVERVWAEAMGVAKHLAKDGARLDAILIDPLNPMLHGGRAGAQLSALALELGATVACTLEVPEGFTLDALRHMGLPEGDLGALFCLKRNAKREFIAEPVWNMSRARYNLSWNPRTCTFKPLANRFGGYASERLAAVRQSGGLFMADKMAEFKIKGRKMNIPNEGLSPLDLGVIVDQLEKDMNDLESKSGVIDVSKQAIITAIHYATELFKLKSNVTTDNAEKKSQ